jgi:hypothetical protein
MDPIVSVVGMVPMGVQQLIGEDLLLAFAGSCGRLDYCYWRRRMRFVGTRASAQLIGWCCITPDTFSELQTEPAMDMLVEHNSREDLSIYPRNERGWIEVGDWRCAACSASNPECMVFFFQDVNFQILISIFTILLVVGPLAVPFCVICKTPREASFQQ